MSVEGYCEWFVAKGEDYELYIVELLSTTEDITCDRLYAEGIKHLIPKGIREWRYRTFFSIPCGQLSKVRTGIALLNPPHICNDYVGTTTVVGGVTSIAVTHHLSPDTWGDIWIWNWYVDNNCTPYYKGIENIQCGKPVTPPPITTVFPTPTPTIPPWIDALPPVLRDIAINIWRILNDFYTIVIKPVIDGIINGIAWLTQTLSDIWNRLVNFVTKDFPEFVDKVKTFISDVYTWFKELPDKIRKLIEDAGKLIEEIPKIPQKIVDLLLSIEVMPGVTLKMVFENLYNSVVEFFKDPYKHLVEAFDKLKEWFKQNVIEPVTTWVKTNVLDRINEFIDMVKERFTDVKDAVLGLPSQVKSLFDGAIADIGEKIGGIFKPLLDFVNWLNTTLTDTWENKILPLLTASKDFFEKIKELLSMEFSTILEKIKEILRGIWDSFYNFIVGKGEDIKKFFTETLPTVGKEFFTSLRKQSPSIDALASFAEWLSKVLNEVVIPRFQSFIEHLPEYGEKINNFIKAFSEGVGLLLEHIDDFLEVYGKFIPLMLKMCSKGIDIANTWIDKLWNWEGLIKEEAIGLW